MTISGKGLVAGVMGWPVSHSLSPILHGYWIEKLGLDATYIPMGVAPDRLGEAVKGLKALGFRGCNVTLPHKEAVMDHLDGIDDAALAIGAVNTIVIDPRGKLIGRNTDVTGFMTHLTASAPSLKLKGARAVIIGAGGAARGAVFGLLDAGVASVTLVNRTRGRAEAIASDFNDPRLTVGDWAHRNAALEGVDLLVNTSTLGQTGQPHLELALDALPAYATVYDIVYNPLITPLLGEARRRKLNIVDGLGMLLHQAVPGFEAWFGVRPEVTQALRNRVISAMSGART